jgi:superfamily II DNA or RNA helicase
VNNTGDFAVVWCNRNEEGDLLERLIPDSIQVSGKDSDDAKEEKLTSFSKGQSRVLVIKPKIGAWGLNWQHCNHTVFFPTYSYEQYYQALRRFLRFGQKREVTMDLVYSEGSAFMLEGLHRKKEQAITMFDRLVKYMNAAQHVKIERDYNLKPDMPAWLK